MNLLTHKSPAWKYEHEVRFIYNVAELIHSPDYRKVEFACEKCRQKGVPAEKCRSSFYRDAVQLPPGSIRAVIFGADCLIQTVREVFQVLSGPEYGHVEFYVSYLHSSRYAVQYLKRPRSYIESVQEEHCRKLASAKGHIYLKGETLVCEAVGKGLGFDPGRRRSPITKGPS